VKTILFCGHLSRFGEAFLMNALGSPSLQIDTIILANVELCIAFTAKLKRIQQLPNEAEFRRNYLSKTKSIVQALKIKAPRSKVIFVEDANSEWVRVYIKPYRAVLTAAFPQIFSTAFLAATPNGAVNFHPSYLPRCRGAHPVYWTIASREEFGGVSSHFMTEKVDQGPLIAREKILFEKYSITYDALYEMALIILPKVIEETIVFLKEDTPKVSIEEALQPTHFRENQSSDHQINWDLDDMTVISAKIRAGNAFCLLSETGQQLYLYPPVTFQRYNLKVKNYSLIKEQSRDFILIESKSGLLYTRFRLEHRFSHNLVFRLLKKVLPRLFFEKLKGRTLC